jgi:hypothetical protein
MNSFGRNILTIGISNETLNKNHLSNEQFITHTDIDGGNHKYTESLFDEIKMIGSIPSEELQAELFRLLKPNCKLSIVGALPGREDGQALVLDLKIQGFKNIMAAIDQESGERFVVCEKPSWEVGTSSGIQMPAISSTSAINKISAWKMDINDLADEDLIDENDLMDDNIILPAPVDCGTDAAAEGKKRACKNCSCGLKEEEEEAACGSCYKGDAFRCGSCPHLGKPAFEPGSDKVLLSMGMDDI